MRQRSPRIARKLRRMGLRPSGASFSARDIAEIDGRWWRWLGGRDVEQVELVEANDGDNVMEWVPCD